MFIWLPLSLYVLLLIALAYYRPPWALVFLFVILPVYAVRFSILGIPATALEASIWAVTGGWFLREWRAHGRPRLSWRQAHDKHNPFVPYLWPVLLWEVAAVAAVAVAPNLPAALGIWKAYFVEPLMVFALTVAVFRQSQQKALILYALGASAVIVSAVAWYQKMTGSFLPEPWAQVAPLRVTSVYSYPNAVGLYLGPILAMYVAWLLQDVRRVVFARIAVLWKLGVVVLGTGAIVFSMTRGAWVGVAAAAGLSLLVTFSSSWRRLVALALVSVIIMLAVPAVRVRLIPYATFQSPSEKIRLIVWQETWAMLKDRPLTGAGLAGSQTALVPYHHPWHKEVSPYALEIFLYPHNIFLNFWSELGLGGLLVFLWILIVFARIVWQQRRETLTQIAAAAMVALLIHGLVDVPYFKNDLAVLFWVIVALPLLDANASPQTGLAGGSAVG